jgi:curved DNA-binding protein CbpA
MRYFDKIQTIEELKQAYKKLVKQYHPDLNPDRDTTEEMKAINAEYEVLFEKVKNIHRNADGDVYEKATSEVAADFIEILNKIINLEGLQLEIIGNWLWVSGNTFAYKKELKDAGLRYSGQKKAWYWHKDPWHKGNNKTASLDDLRIKYGSENIQSEPRKKLA